jgi:hypothetical protein
MREVNLILELGEDGEIHLCPIDNGGICLINGKIILSKKIPGC